MSENELNKFREGEVGFTEVDHSSQIETTNDSKIETAVEEGIETVENEKTVHEEVVNEPSEETIFVDHQHLGLRPEQIKGLHGESELNQNPEENEHDKKAEADLFEHGAGNPREILENLLR